MGARTEAELGGVAGQDELGEAVEPEELGAPCGGGSLACCLVDHDARGADLGLIWVGKSSLAGSTRSQRFAVGGRAWARSWPGLLAVHGCH